MLPKLKKKNLKKFKITLLFGFLFGLDLVFLFFPTCFLLSNNIFNYLGPIEVCFNNFFVFEKDFARTGTSGRLTSLIFFPLLECLSVSACSLLGGVISIQSVKIDIQQHR